jgi:hypothetical protein
MKWFCFFLILVALKASGQPSQKVKQKANTPPSTLKMYTHEVDTAKKFNSQLVNQQNPQFQYDSLLTNFFVSQVGQFARSINTDSILRTNIFRPCVDAKGADYTNEAKRNFDNAFLAFAEKNIIDSRLTGAYRKDPKRVMGDIYKKLTDNSKIDFWVNRVCESMKPTKPNVDTFRTKEPPTKPETNGDKGTGSQDQPNQTDNPHTAKTDSPQIKKDAEKKKKDTAPKPHVDTSRMIADTSTATTVFPPHPNGNSRPGILIYIISAVLLFILGFTVHKLASAPPKIIIRQYSNPDQLPAYHSNSLNELDEEFLSSSTSLNQGLKKSLFWSMRLMQVTNGGYPFAKIPGYKYTAYGFFRTKWSHEYQFGVIVYKDDNLFAKILFSLRNFIRPYSVYTQADGEPFPVIYRSINERTHSFTCNPVNGTGTCYVSDITANSPTGVLTAKHVTGTKRGKKIRLSCGGEAKVALVGEEGIDAAVVDSGCIREHSKKAKEIFPEKFIPPFIEAEFWGAISDVIKTRVEHVTDTRGVLNSAYLPVRIFLKEAGSDGDSGALVEGAKPLGIYMGLYSSQGIGTGGIAQHLYQVTQIMQLKTYK